MDLTAIKDELARLEARERELDAQAAAIQIERSDISTVRSSLKNVVAYFSKRQADDPLLPGIPPADSVSEEQEADHEPGTQPIKKSILLRAALRLVPTDFTTQDVFDRVEGEGADQISKDDVSFFLSRLKRNKDISVRQQGAGKTMTVYTKEIL